MATVVRRTFLAGKKKSNITLSSEASGMLFIKQQ